MSRVGKKVIEVPKEVKVSLNGPVVEVQGPKGKLTTPVPEGITFKLEDNKLQAVRESDQQAALHGRASRMRSRASPKASRRRWTWSASVTRPNSRAATSFSRSAIRTPSNSRCPRA